MRVDAATLDLSVGHFEVDAPSIAFAAVSTLVRDGKLKKAALKKAAGVFGIVPVKQRSW